LRILVTGATGTVGRHVVERLVERGVRVRALTRRPESAALPKEVEIAQGDLDSPDSEVFRGVDRMYLLALGDTQLAVDLAKQGGVRRIVTLSSMAEDEFHRGAERTVESSGLEWTHVRPGMFMANLGDWADGIREGVVREPYAQTAQAPVHEVDIAEVAVEALLEDGHNGRSYTLTGPQLLTKVKQAREIGEAIGKTVRFEELTPMQWREVVKDRIPDFVIEFLLELWETADESVLNTVEDVLGRPAKTLAEWAVDHKADFR
jgi:uncharacterized protein YbjT (DUF2867 family)